MFVRCNLFKKWSNEIKRGRLNMDYNPRAGRSVDASSQIHMKNTSLVDCLQQRKLVKLSRATNVEGSDVKSGKTKRG
ncbi:hypothetical protein EVAR_13025_1 [Eumeta japonica]|uniref:Uncharacterized protein n=1 Tax=Eumeta variegata TaxID=151549 RepID=A0A4C1TXF5_EUMVA|nr:hypothetical protein EVAR_13025_1 [Eumeta japonica]